MTRSNSISAAQLIGWLTLSVCVAAVFEPRLRRACFGLLCRL
jgi:hypothetical protein